MSNHLSQILTVSNGKGRFLRANGTIQSFNFNQIKLIIKSSRTKFYDLDSKPVCKHCFEKLPSKVKTQINKSFDTKDKDTLSSSVSKDSPTSSASSVLASTSKFTFGRKKDK